MKGKMINSALAGSVCAMALMIAGPASAERFNIPAGDLEHALSQFTAQTGAALLVSNEAIKGITTKGASGTLSEEEALSRLLTGTGFVMHRQSSGAITIVPGHSASAVQPIDSIVLAQATPMPRAVETVTVTSSKLGGADVQSIPIAITAL